MEDKKFAQLLAEIDALKKRVAALEKFTGVAKPEAAANGSDPKPQEDQPPPVPPGHGN